MIIKGILARDNTGWQEDFAEEVAKNGFGVMWKDQFSDIDEVVPLLNNLITEKGFFNYYNIANNVTNYRMKIVDFATKDTYDAKKKEWKQKNPAWFFDTFDEYSDGKQNAKIAFLVESVEKIESEKSISIEDFKTYKDKQASRKNAVAYTKIITIKEINMKQTIETLTTNYNLILTGAPGTGKTYLAKQIAQQMIFGEIKEKMSDEELKQFNEQCGFVQFHPSYDYTDFVEGLRPVQDETGNVGFERKNGVFKEFCKKALKTLEACYSDLLRDISNSKNFTLKQKGGNDTTALSVDDEKRIRWIERNNPEKIASNYVSFDNLKILYEKYNTFEKLNNIENINEEIRKTIEGTADTTYYWTVLNELLHRMREKIFVFIIDEINRGEISKIFGELFFSIDPGYRGTDGKVRTQYANMQTTPNDFDKSLGITDSNNYGHFFVPENVYIIGTMNDIDRSVESMDFAFRRRFAFKEITAEESKQMLDSENAWGKDENGNSRKPDQVDIDIIKSKMDSINNVIWHKVKEDVKDEDKSIEGLSSAYHIGASYFLKLVNYKNADGSYDYDQLWENHLEGLLLEYMRGMADVQKKIKKLANAYGYSKMNKYE